MKLLATFTGDNVEGMVEVFLADKGDLILRLFNPDSLRVRKPEESAKINEPPSCQLIFHQDGTWEYSPEFRVMCSLENQLLLREIVRGGKWEIFKLEELKQFHSAIGDWLKESRIIQMAQLITRLMPLASAKTIQLMAKRVAYDAEEALGDDAPDDDETHRIQEDAMDLLCLLRDEPLR